MEDRLKKLLSLHEGRVAHAYQDSLGWWTIGVGHLIDARKGGKLPEHIIDALLDYDIKTKTETLLRVAPWVVGLDEVRRVALIDMAFNLGPGIFNQHSRAFWPRFNNALRRADWGAASDIMLNTKWAKQVGARARRLAGMVRRGVWPSDI
jgi:lysozyme